MREDRRGDSVLRWSLTSVPVVLRFVLGGLWLCGLGVAAAGCGAQPISIRSGPRSFTENDYSEVYKAWTREEEQFAWGNLASVMHVTATFESWEFRWAYVVRYSHDHALDTEARASMLRATLDDAREHHRFFITLAGADFRESDITGRHSAWRVLLVDERGKQTTPLEIERVSRPSAADQTYFPSVSVHRHAFRMVFPSKKKSGKPTIRPDARFMILRFTGARGTVDLKWEFSRAAPIEGRAQTRETSLTLVHQAG